MAKYEMGGFELCFFNALFFYQDTFVFYSGDSECIVFLGVLPKAENGRRFISRWLMMAFIFF